MTNEERVLLALSGQPLDVVELQDYTAIPREDLWVVLRDLCARGVVTEVLHPRGLAVDFVRVQR